MDILVSTDWLAGEIGKPDLVILDASLFLPGTPRDPRAEYDAAHSPGAAFMDLPSLSDPADPARLAKWSEVYQGVMEQAHWVKDGQATVASRCLRRDQTPEDLTGALAFIVPSSIGHRGVTAET